MTSWTGLLLLDRYRVGERVGRGGMGAVYVADDLRRPGWKVAVKHPLRAAEGTPGGLTDAELRRRFHAEVGKLIALGEIPGIVRIEDQGEHEGTPFYVMRFLTGGSLEDRLQAGPQAPSDVLAWARPVAKALDRLHARTPMLVHRDVKPANVLFDDYDQAHLADFGIVKELAAAWATTGAAANTGLGTPLYMAPEQVLPDGEVDGRTDQFALAATMYEALTGSPPRYESTGGAARAEQGATGARAAAKKRLTPVHDLAAHVLPGASAAVSRGLAKEQDERFPTCAALVEAFERGLAPARGPSTGHEPRVGAARAPAQPPAPASAPPVRAHPGRGRTATLLLALALLGGGGYLAYDRLRARDTGAVAPRTPGPGGPTRGTPTGERPVEPPPPPPAKDTTAPVVVVTEPAAAEVVTTAERLVVRGTVSDDGGPEGLFLMNELGEPVPTASDGSFAHEVALALDATRVVSLVAQDRAGNPSAAAVRRLTREAPWAGALRDATTAMERDDGDAAKAALARPEARGMPADKADEVTRFVARWDQEPAVSVQGETPITAAPKPGEPRTVRVRFRFASGRKRDRLFVDGGDLGGPGEHDIDLTRAAPGRQAVPFEVRTGGTLRKSGAVDVAFPADVVPEPPKPPGPKPEPLPRWAEGLLGKQQILEAEKRGIPAAFENPFGMRFVLIPPGTFEMGSPPDEPDRLESEVRRRVTLTKPYYLQVTEVSIADYQRHRPEHGVPKAAFRDGMRPGPTYALDDPLQPAVNMTFDDARAYARWLGTQGDGRTYRLPTEAEWEMACRAGTTGRWWWGEDVSETGRCANVGDRTWNRATWKMPESYVADFNFPVEDGHVVASPVGSFRPNPFGLHDMLGNAWEMCSDWASVPGSEPQTDPRVDVAPGGENRVAQGLGTATLGVVVGNGPGTVIKGGCWAEHRWSVRSAARASLPPQRAFDVVGFRLLVEVR